MLVLDGDAFKQSVAGQHAAPDQFFPAVLLTGITSTPIPSRWLPLRAIVTSENALCPGCLGARRQSALPDNEAAISRMTEREIYSEDRYFAAFKRVRNRIRKFYALDIIVFALIRLHSQKQGDVESLRRQPPWFLLLIIKWTIMYGDFVRGGKRTLDDLEFNRIINLMHDVDRSLRLPSQYSNPLMFLRGMAYQQLWHQTSLSRSGLSRQAVLFRRLDASHRFRVWFREQTGIGIDEWIDLSFMLLAVLLDENTHWTTDAHFTPVNHTYSAAQVSVFFRSVSRSPSELRQYLRSLKEEQRRDSSEFRERSPLLGFPLIELAGKHYYYSMPLLAYSLENFIYDTLRGACPDEFMSAFGPIFERYVKHAMEYLGEPFMKETEILGQAHGSKVVDFAILGEEANIMIDAKGVEMAHGGMTSHRPEVITGQAKASILKGIEQGVRTARLLSKDDPSRWSRERNFLLIVTFKDVYLGTGSDMSGYIVKERLARALDAPASESIIPLENMYFVSIDEFEHLIEALKTNDTSLGEFLREVSVLDQDPETKCLQILQHLHRRWGELSGSAYIENEFNALFERAARTLLGRL